MINEAQIESQNAGLVSSMH